MPRARACIILLGALLLGLALLQVGSGALADSCVGHHCGGGAVAETGHANDRGVLCLRATACGGGASISSSSPMAAVAPGLSEAVELASLAGLVVVLSALLVPADLTDRLFRPPRVV